MAPRCRYLFSMAMAVLLLGATSSEPTSLLRLQHEQPLSTLPSNSNASLSLVAVGVGTQNYSCSHSGTSSSIGAVAVLYDITTFLEEHSNVTMVSQHASDDYLQAYLQGKNASQSNPYKLDKVGRHYFADVNGAAVPSFSLPGFGFLSAEKADNYSSPAGATNVDWLFLPNDGSARSQNLTEAYRLSTSSGVLDSCTDPHDVPYAALYWFYGVPRT